MEFYLDLIHAIEFVISPVPYITALKVFMKSFKGVCLWDSLFVSGLNQCRTWNCFACYGIFSEVGTAILAGSVVSTSEPVLLESFWSDSDVPIRARINSWIELELIINSIQFSMNWIGIELKDFELELNWNWKPELIGIDQFIFNSTPHFIRLNIFLYAILWKL